MNSGGLSRRYVQPLFEVALEKDQLDRVAGDLKALDDALKESPELRGFLGNPSRDRQSKQAVVDDLFKEASPFTMNFMRVVIDKNRNEIFDTAYSLFTELLNRHRGVTTGLLETAQPISDEEFNDVRKRLESQFDIKLDLERTVDPSIMGGARIRVGNTLIDGSVSGRLEKLKKELIAI